MGKNKIKKSPLPKNWQRGGINGFATGKAVCGPSPGRVAYKREHKKEDTVFRSTDGSFYQALAPCSASKAWCKAGRHSVKIKTSGMKKQIGDMMMQLRISFLICR
jgi:hypothetical protein